MSSRAERGFTLLELLVVTAIVGILASIAIPQYARYRASGYDSSVASTVRNVATGEEGYFAVHQEYAADVNELEGMVLDEVEITLGPGNSGNLETSFKVEGSHAQAAHDYAWVSDPAPGDPNFLVTPK